VSKPVQTDVLTETRTETHTEASQEQAYRDAIAHTALDPKLFTGAFATNVWGGRYAVDGVLGRGGQGTTLAGNDLKTGARVAVKLFDLSKAKDWKALSLFDREVETLKSVSHPLMPRFLDVIVDEGTGVRALVMTQVPGESLDALVKRQGAMSEAELWRVLVDVTSVLEALHAQAIVHRDLKPHNLLRRPDGTHAVVDFGGVGRVRQESGSTVVGTFGYMAPEQLYGAQTPATDMYSLGATLLALATGQEPEGLPRAGLAFDVDQAAPHLSEPLRRLIGHLCAPEPKARPADARALKRELQSIAEARSRPRAAPSWSTSGSGPAERTAEHQSTRLTHGDDAMETFVGVVSVLIGFLGVAGAVVIGQVLLPLLLTILASFSAPEQRARLEALRERVKDAAGAAKKGFAESAQSGARTLEVLSERSRQRHHEHRRFLEEGREQARRLKRELKAARRQRRKDRRGG
jgi:hypothetical protein